MLRRSANDTHAPLGSFVSGPEHKAELLTGLFRDHPPAKSLREFAIDFDSADPVVERVAVVEFELALHIDLDEGPAVGLLRFVELVPVVAPGSLAVVELVERVPEDGRGAATIRIKAAQFSYDGV